MSELASTTTAYTDLVALLHSVPEAAGYEETIASLAMTVRPERPSLFAIFLTALGDVETHWGKAKGYIDGRGDWTLRAGHWVREAGVSVVTAPPPGTPWRLPKDKAGNVLPGPYAMPEDGKGFGLYELQLDWPHARLVGPDDRTACLLAAARIADACTLAFPGRLDAAAAAYNAGCERVHHALSAGLDPNVVTTGGDYATRVLAVFHKRSLLVIPDGSGDPG